MTRRQRAIAFFVTLCVLLVAAAVALIVGAGNYTLHWGDYEFAGIALGTLAAVVVYQILRPLSAERPSPPTDREPVLESR